MKINGQAFKAARERADFRQAELAHGICSTAMLSKIENGKANPSEELVGKLVAKLGIPIDQLIAE